MGRLVLLIQCPSWFLILNHLLCTPQCLCRCCILLLPFVTITLALSSHTVALMYCLLPSSGHCYLVPLHFLPGHLPLSVSPLRVRACISFIKSFSTLLSLSGKSSDTSCIRSCSVFLICFSRKLKSRRGHCSLVLALLPSQSSLDQSNGVLEDVGHQTCNICTPCVFLCIVI